MIEKGTSKKITIIQSFCCVLVIFIHSTGYKYFALDDSTFGFLTKLFLDFFTDWLPQISVSFFFIISGFLFFKDFNEKKFNFEIYKKKLLKRFFTIVIPYFICNLVWLLFNMLIQQFPFIMNNITSLPMYDWNIDSFIKGIVFGEFAGITWYLRYLIIFFLLSPLIWIFIVKSKVTCILALLLTFILSTNLHYDLSRFNSLFFFTLGAFICLKGKKYLSYKYSDKQILIAFIISFICILAYSVLVEDSWFSCVIRIIHIVSLWISFDKINSNGLILFSKFSMFIYLYHGQTQQCINKIFQIFLSNFHLQWLMAIINTFGGVFITVLVLMVLGSIFEKKCNQFWKLLVGFR